MSTTTALPTIGLIGYGEVGQILATELAQRGCHNLTAWDVLFDDPDSCPSRASIGMQIRRSANLAEASQRADILICAVTAAQCSAVAREVSAWLKPGTLYLDLNSVSPAVRVEAAAIVSAAGARYLEAAVMSTIVPKGIATPMLLGGPDAADCLVVLQRLGFSGARRYSDLLGVASAAKMCRSVLVKGLEALFMEALLAARHYGVDESMLQSVSDLFPGADVRALGSYMISRSLLHGRRRAEEMREVARTVRDAGLIPRMSVATAAQQEACGNYAYAARITPLDSLLDTLLAEHALCR